MNRVAFANFERNQPISGLSRESRYCFQQYRAALDQKLRPSRAWSLNSPLLQAEAVGTACVLFAVFQTVRPRGWCDSAQVQVRESGVHNRGVFARQYLPCGTVLGAYPGFATRATNMAEKVEKYPQAGQYVFNADNGWFLDPTDAQGRPNEGRLWGITDTTLAFINEPPPGEDVNVVIRRGSGPLDVLFVTDRDIAASEELLVDYGRTYDRRNYNRADM